MNTILYIYMHALHTMPILHATNMTPLTNIIYWYKTSPLKAHSFAHRITRLNHTPSLPHLIRYSPIHIEQSSLDVWCHCSECSARRHSTRCNCCHVGKPRLLFCAGKQLRHQRLRYRHVRSLSPQSSVKHTYMYVYVYVCSIKGTCENSPLKLLPSSKPSR
jgi:hypothetical protein